MIENRATLAISPQTMQAISQKLNELQELLKPFTVSLTNDERKSMLKMSDKSRAFVLKTQDYVRSNPEFVPPFMNVNDFKVDLDNANQLMPLLGIAEQVCKNLNTIATVSGSEAFTAALQYYNTVKQGDKNGISNAGPVYEDLLQRFPGRRIKASPQKDKG